MKKSLVISLVVILGLGLVFLFLNNAEEEVVMDSSDVSNQEVEVAEETELNDDSDMYEDDSGVELDVDVEVSVTEHVFTVDSFNYGYSMEEIRVKEGDTVTINLTNSDGFHDWAVDEFGATTEKISAGGETSVTFVASKKGTFEFYCSVGNHRAQGMVGNLIVE